MEMLDIYDSNGKVTGRQVIRGDKSVKLNADEHIALAVIFIENSKGEYLIQKSSEEKGSEYGTTGGHVDAGEIPSEAIKREVKEELGINVDNEDIKELGYMLYDVPIRYMYYLKKDININDIKVQAEEVEFVKYMSIDEINDIIDKDLMTKSHAIQFEEMLKRIK